VRQRKFCVDPFRHVERFNKRDIRFLRHIREAGLREVKLQIGSGIGTAPQVGAAPPEILYALAEFLPPGGPRSLDGCARQCFRQGPV
jgi:hypothetical protein